jgi:hypothetical protein
MLWSLVYLSVSSNEYLSVNAAVFPERFKLCLGIFTEFVFNNLLFKSQRALSNTIYIFVPNVLVYLTTL